MKKLLIGWFLILAGIALGLYVGVWLLLIGGAINIVEYIKAGFEPNMVLAVGLLKMLIGLPTGHLVMLFLVVPGVEVIKEA